MKNMATDTSLPWAQHPIRTLHACVETLASAFKGYLPWPDEKRDSVVRGHEILIEDTLKRADACMTIIRHAEEQRETALQVAVAHAEDSAALLSARSESTASTDEIIERCAKVCEARGRHPLHDIWMADDYARDVRALKNAAPQVDREIGGGREANTPSATPAPATAASAVTETAATSEKCGKLNDGIACELPKGTACPDCAPASRSATEAYTQEQDAFDAWWRSRGDHKFSEHPALAAGAAWMARASRSSTACSSYFPDEVTDRCIRCGRSQGEHTVASRSARGYGSNDPMISVPLSELEELSLMAAVSTADPTIDELEAILDGIGDKVERLIPNTATNRG